MIRGSRASPARIAAVYLVFGLLWIWLSDSLLALAGVGGELGYWAATFKGTTFILISAAVVYLTARRENRVQRQSTRLLEAVVNGTSDAIFVKDTAGRYLLFNEGAARLVGRPAATVLGRDDSYLFDPDGAGRVMDRDRRVLASGQSETEEEELTADGITRTYLATKAPYLDDSGAVVGVIGISRDITDRKRAERELRESEERFRSLVELAPDAIVLLVSGRVAFANAAAARMVCAPTPETMLGVSLNEHLHPDDRPHSLVRQTAVVERGEVYLPHEVRIRRLDGEHIDVETCAGPCVVGGEPGIQVIARDITERKRDAVFLTRQNSILEQITTGHALPHVLDEIVSLVESVNAGTVGSILLLEREGRLRLGSAPNLPPAYNAAIDGVLIGPSVGSCGTAAYTRQSVFVADIATDPRWADFAALALSHRLRACWSVPIFASARGDTPPAVLGTFAVYSRTPRAPNPRTVELLGRAGHLASIAIERDRADRELRESEGRFRTLVENATDGIFLHDERGVVTDANKWACESLGYSRDELIGMSPVQFDVTVTPESSRELAIKVQDGELITFEGVHRRKDGSTFPVEVRLRQFIADGRRQGLSFVRDITGRRRAQQRLAVQHAVASILAEADHLREAAPRILRTVCQTLGWAAGGVWTLDREKTRLVPVEVWGAGEGVDSFVSASRRLTFVRGVGLPGRVWEGGKGVWLPDVTVEPTFVRQREASAAGFLGAFAFPIRSGSQLIGVIDFYHTHSAPPDDELLRVFEVIGNQIGQFVERNRSRAALQESEGRLAEAQRLARMGSWRWIPDTDQVWWSDALYCLFGVAPAGVRASFEGFLSCLHPDDRPRAVRRVEEVRAGAAGFADELRVIRPDGEVRWIHSQAWATRDATGRILHVEGTDFDITEKRQAEQALRESEGWLRLFVEHAPAALAMFDRDMRYMIASRRWASDYRLTETDLIGRSHYDIFPEIPAEWRAVHVRALAGEVLRAERDSFVRADGTTQWLRWEVRPWYDRTSAVGGIVMFADDITASVVGETALRENEERFRRLVDSIMDGVISIDADQKVMLFNPAAERMFGLPAAEVLGGPLDRLIPTPHRAHHSAYVAGFMRTGVTNRSMAALGAVSAVRGDGTEFPIEASLSQIEVNGQKVATAIVRDISARVRAEADLRESEERFRATFEQAAVGVSHVAPDGRFLRVNERFCQITGFTLEEMLSSDFQSITHPDDLTADLEFVHQLLAGELPHYAMEKRYIRKGGGFVWVNITVSLRRDAAGEPLHFISVAEDITARKAAEAAVRQSDERLRQALTAARMVTWQFDPTSGALALSDNADDVFGLPPGSTLDVAEQGFGLVHPEDLDRHRAAVMGAVERCGTFLSRFRLIRPIDRAVVWMEDRGKAVHEPDGAVRIGGVMIDITARQEAEERLRESEERLRFHAENSPLAVIEWDADFRISRWTEGAERLFGWSAGEVVGRNPADWQFVHGDDAAEVGRVMSDLTSGGVERNVSANRNFRADGEVVHCEWYNSALFGADGRPRSILSLVLDVTERVRAETALRLSEERFRTLIEFLPDAIFLNVGGRVNFCNPACVRLFGASRDEEVIGKTPFELFHSDDYEAIRRRIAHMEATGEAVPPLEERVVRLDGDVTPVSVTAVPIQDAGRNAMLVVLRDLTEQRRMETQLRHQDLMIREAGELAHVGGWGFDPATLVGDWTAETARIHGVGPSTEMVVGVGLSRFAGEDRLRIEAAVQAAISHGTPYDLELLLTAADGREKWVRTICRPIVDNGRVVRVRGSIQDITDRKRAEEEIRELNAGLEQRVRERTAELQAVNRELESFSYSVSHDLRAPIRHITAFASLALESGGAGIPQESRQHLEQVTKAAGRMGQLVDDLLRFSRLGRQPVRRQPVNTRQLVEDCLQEVLSTADPRRFATRVGDLPDCEGDLVLLRQVWLNLLANAVKYTGPRDPAVVEAGVEGTPEGVAYFVRDNGVGFDMQYAHKLFGVFQRLHRAEEFEGTGIGLALVQRIVHRHGGRVWATSEPGRGATFYFTLGNAERGGPADAETA